MIIIKIWHLPFDQMGDDMRRLRASVVDICEEILPRLKGHIFCIFPLDRIAVELDTEILVEITGFWPEPRNQEPCEFVEPARLVATALAGRVGSNVKLTFPEHDVFCHVSTETRTSECWTSKTQTV